MFLVGLSGLQSMSKQVQRPCIKVKNSVRKQHESVHCCALDKGWSFYCCNISRTEISYFWCGVPKVTWETGNYRSVIVDMLLKTQKLTKSPVYIWYHNIKSKVEISSMNMNFFKVHIFWERHKILWNLHRRFDRYYIGQIYGGDFAKICGLLRMYELYRNLQVLI